MNFLTVLRADEMVFWWDANHELLCVNRQCERILILKLNARYDHTKNTFH